MLTPDQISEIHRLHWVEKWSLRKIAQHLRIGRRTLTKYLETPAQKPARRDRASKLDPFKAAIAELLQQDPAAHAPVIAQRLRRLGYNGGITVIKDYLRAVRKTSVARRAFVRMESAGHYLDNGEVSIMRTRLRSAVCAAREFAHAPILRRNPVSHKSRL
jgi:transposase